MLDSLIKATVLLLLVALSCHLLRRRSASLRHLLWTLGIVGLVAIPVLTAWAPFELAILPSATTRPLERLDTGTTAVREASRSDTARGASVALASTRDIGQIPRSACVDGSGCAPDDRATLTPRTVLLLIWAAGALLLLARFVAGWVAVRRIVGRAREVTDERSHALADRAARSLGVAHTPQLRESDEVEMPFACGFLAPVIVIPASASDWTTEHREAVLMHELAHVSRGDLPMNALSHVVRALYWFHPLAWLASHRLRVEGERACDDAVLRAGTLPSYYAEHLLNIVRSAGRNVPSVALAMARRSDFEGRLLAILEPGTSRARLSRVRAAAVALAFAAVVMPLAAIAPARAAALPPSSLQQAEQPPVPQAAAGAVAALIETLGDASPAVRAAAISSLGKLQDPRAIAALAKALREDTDPRVREAAAYAIGEIDDSRAVAPLLEALRTEKVPSVREKIVHALGEIDDPSAAAGISAVIKDPSVKVRREAVWALGELADPSSVPSLISMARDEDAAVRQHTAQALGELKNVAAIDALMTLTRDTHADVRQQAVQALGELQDQRALPALLAALKDAKPDVRSQAAAAIHELEDMKTAPPALIEALSDPNREVRRSAAHALGNIEDAAAVPALKRLTSDTDAEVRRAAAEALSDIGGPEAIQALMGLLKDQDPEVRRIAAEALGSKRH